MLVSVIICTWNRAELLKGTLEQMTKLRIPVGIDWELLVVNNACTDSTDKVIRSYARHLPLRRLFEPKLGKSNALNLAIREARGEYILWTDDDVLVGPQWLEEYVFAFERHSDAAIFGGPIEPLFIGNSPAWFRQALNRVLRFYSHRDFGDTSIPLSQEVIPYGANWAVRKGEQEKYRYDPRLGPVGNRVIKGEETTVIRRMLASGIKGIWVPNAKVTHYIPKERQTTTYLRQCGFQSGVFGNFQDSESGQQNDEDKTKSFFGKPFWVWRLVLESELKYRFRRLFCPPEVWVEDLFQAAQAWGRLLSWERH